MEEVLKYIESDYAQNIGVNDIADKLNIDRSYLFRLFKAVTGTSLKNYLLNYRMKKACDLLTHTDYPVSVIARSVGYEDALYFSRLFRSKRGISLLFTESRANPLSVFSDTFLPRWQNWINPGYRQNLCQRFFSLPVNPLLPRQRLPARRFCGSEACVLLPPCPSLRIPDNRVSFPGLLCLLLSIHRILASCNNIIGSSVA